MTVLSRHSTNPTNCEHFYSFHRRISGYPGKLFETLSSHLYLSINGGTIPSETRGSICSIRWSVSRALFAWLTFCIPNLDHRGDSLEHETSLKYETENQE